MYAKKEAPPSVQKKEKAIKNKKSRVYSKYLDPAS